MSSVGAREANRSFSKILREAESGKTVTITRNGRPVAQLVPVAPLVPPKRSKKSLKKFLDMLEKGFDLGGKGFTRDEMHER
ncbi:MAG TPA: type II toxin-antitoxin system prevent-host-death family antitoxin [Rhizomicrobium sp.]|jgi:prevent-host-death family protein|nr:type II toxin-antitoxin system prevent-host-death family antitoxin [Rhizomicrobium sp.]